MKDLVQTQLHQNANGKAPKADQETTEEAIKGLVCRSLVRGSRVRA